MECSGAEDGDDGDKGGEDAGACTGARIIEEIWMSGTPVGVEAVAWRSPMQKQMDMRKTKPVIAPM